MVRKGPYRRDKGAPAYYSKDNTKIKIIMYLLAKGKANKNKMQNDAKAGLRGQEWTRFTNILDEMVVLELIEKTSSEDVEGVTVYRLLDRGKEMALLIKELQQKNHPLLNLESFRDINSCD